MNRILFLGIAFSLFSSTLVNGEGVELNVIPSGRASFGAAQKWMQTLSSLRTVRVRSDRSKAAQPEAKWVGSTLYITGVIGANNELIVPGRKFSVRQTKDLVAWIGNQKKTKTDGPLQTKDQRFGMTLGQLQQVHDLLKPALTDSTKNKPTAVILRTVARTTGLPLKINRTELKALAGDTSAIEWKGFSVGTALAALLRRHELVMVPEFVGNQIQLRVQSESDATDAWPVGWPPRLKNHELVPKLLDTLPIDIYDTPIRDVMTAIESRLETSIFFDESLCLAAKLDPSKTNVTVSSTKSFYGKVIRQALFKAKMSSEVRTDELGKPFFWVQPAGRIVGRK